MNHKEHETTYVSDPEGLPDEADLADAGVRYLHRSGAPTSGTGAVGGGTNSPGGTGAPASGTGAVGGGTNAPTGVHDAERGAASGE